MQSLSLLSYWRESDDARSWARTGYAIRLAQALGLCKRAERPLPKDSASARLILVRLTITSSVMIS